jgi:hypothetical protein
LCDSLNQFFSVALYSLRLPFRFSLTHKSILAFLVPVSTPQAAFLQDSIIREYRLTTVSLRAFRIQFTSKYDSKENNAEAQTWKGQLGSIGHRARLHG